jgi:V8-like Glu-specific endopeptidase
MNQRQNLPDSRRGIWYWDERQDFYAIPDERVKKNALSAAAVCFADDLMETRSGYWELRVKKYGETYNLGAGEKFHGQPVAAGPFCSAVLVEEDIVATAAHFVDERNVTKLCFFFGYVMENSNTPCTKIADEEIYRGTAILHRHRDVKGPGATGSDWALVKLDHKVKDREIPVLSTKRLFYEQPVYILGYPCGLPLKYAPGIVVQNHQESYFMAETDVFCNNSGSPVFDAETHEMVGIVSRGDCRDFRWSGDRVVPVIYPDPGILSLGTRCTKVSEFIEYCHGLQPLAGCR